VSEPQAYQQAIATLVRTARSYLGSATAESDPTPEQVRQAIAKVSETQDPGGLALILDDPLAPKVLAWWQASNASMARFAEFESQLAADVGVSRGALAPTLQRCMKVKLLEEGGISQLAAGFLRNHVAQSVGVKKSKKKP